MATIVQSTALVITTRAIPMVFISKLFTDITVNQPVSGTQPSFTAVVLFEDEQHLFLIFFPIRLHDLLHWCFIDLIFHGPLHIWGVDVLLEVSQEDDFSCLPCQSFLPVVFLFSNTMINLITYHFMLIFLELDLIHDFFKAVITDGELADFTTVVGL